MTPDIAEYSAVGSNATLFPCLILKLVIQMALVVVRSNCMCLT